MKSNIVKLIGFLLIAVPCLGDLTLIQKYSHKTSFSLEQMVFKADYILKVKKNSPFTSVKKITFNKKDKCPPYDAVSYNFTVLDIVKGDGNIQKGNFIKVKEPFSDMSYTMHYSYYTRGFVIEPFLGQYDNKLSIDKMDQMLIFINKFSGKNISDNLLQFSILNAFENVAKKDTIVKILNRPPADMKRLFLKKKKTQ